MLHMAKNLTSAVSIPTTTWPKTCIIATILMHCATFLFQVHVNDKERYSRLATLKLEVYVQYMHELSTMFALLWFSFGKNSHMVMEVYGVHLVKSCNFPGSGENVMEHMGKYIIWIWCHFCIKSRKDKPEAYCTKHIWYDIFYEYFIEIPSACILFDKLRILIRMWHC